MHAAGLRICGILYGSIINRRAVNDWLGLFWRADIGSVNAD